MKHLLERPAVRVSLAALVLTALGGCVPLLPPPPPPPPPPPRPFPLASGPATGQPIGLAADGSAAFSGGRRIAGEGLTEETDGDRTGAAAARQP